MFNIYIYFFSFENLFLIIFLNIYFIWYICEMNFLFEFDDKNYNIKYIIIFNLEIIVEKKNIFEI